MDRTNYFSWINWSTATQFRHFTYIWVSKQFESTFLRKLEWSMVFTGARVRNCRSMAVYRCEAMARSSCLGWTTNDKTGKGFANMAPRSNSPWQGFGVHTLMLGIKKRTEGKRKKRKKSGREDQECLDVRMLSISPNQSKPVMVTEATTRPVKEHDLWTALT